MWELHETVRRELYVCRPHHPARVPAGRIMTFGEGERRRRSPGSHGFDVVAIVMPVYVRSDPGKGRRFGDADEVECEAVPNRELADRILAVVNEVMK